LIKSDDFGADLSARLAAELGNVSSAFLDGRGWVRTSDLPRVKRALSR
jgi:hypothetical protein